MRSEGEEEWGAGKGKGREFGRKRRREELQEDDDEGEEKMSPVSLEEQAWRDFFTNRTMVIDVETRRSRKEMALRVSAVEDAVDGLAQQQKEIMRMLKEIVVLVGDLKAEVVGIKKAAGDKTEEERAEDEEMTGAPAVATEQEGGNKGTEEEMEKDGDKRKDGAKDGEENGDGDVEME